MPTPALWVLRWTPCAVVCYQNILSLTCMSWVRGGYWHITAGAGQLASKAELVSAAALPQPRAVSVRAHQRCSLTLRLVNGAARTRRASMPAVVSLSPPDALTAHARSRCEPSLALQSALYLRSTLSCTTGLESSRVLA